MNKVVDAGYKAIWGESEQTANEQTTASSSQPTTSTGVTGIAAVDKVVEAGKRVIWGEDGEKSQETSQVHGEEPVSGKMGLGTATDPYDAGNREGMPFFSPLYLLQLSPIRNRELIESQINTELLPSKLPAYLPRCQLVNNVISRTPSPT